LRIGDPTTTVNQKTSFPAGNPGRSVVIDPAKGQRARLFNSERFKRNFVTALAGLRGELGFRIAGYVSPAAGGTVTYCSGPRTAPNPTQIMQRMKERAAKFILKNLG
jgi:hypothetical protein